MAAYSAKECLLSLLLNSFSSFRVNVEPLSAVWLVRLANNREVETSAEGTKRWIYMHAKLRHLAFEKHCFG